MRTGRYSRIGVRVWETNVAELLNSNSYSKLFALFRRNRNAYKVQCNICGWSPHVDAGGMKIGSEYYKQNKGLFVARYPKVTHFTLYFVCSSDGCGICCSAGRASIVWMVPNKALYSMNLYFWLGWWWWWVNKELAEESNVIDSSPQYKYFTLLSWLTALWSMRDSARYTCGPWFNWPESPSMRRS